MRLLKPIGTRLVLSVIALLSWASPGLAEATADGVHWGAIAFLDHDRTPTPGFTTDRFTEFDGAGQRDNDIHETDGRKNSGGLPFDSLLECGHLKRQAAAGSQREVRSERTRFSYAPFPPDNKNQRERTLATFLSRHSVFAAAACILTSTECS